MSTGATDGYALLTEREKQTLRLIVRGHDAKSVARHLGLSVHTVNERLRDARRKLAVSSSREAARLLLEREGDTPHSLVPMQIGEAMPAIAVEQPAPPAIGGRTGRRALALIGVALMTLFLALLALTTLPQQQPAASAPVSETIDPTLERSAREWLELVDAGRWDDSYEATGASFRTLNTLPVWTAASRKVRTPLGPVRSRTFVGHDTLLAPPHGYEQVRFRTDFANKAGATETVSLFREGDAWRVVGIVIE